MNVRLTITALLLLGLTWSGCKKYEEGPRISLKSKKARVVNLWQYEEFIQFAMCVGPCNTNYLNVTTDYQLYYIEFKDDDTFLDSRRLAGWTEPKNYEGEWKLIDKKEWIDMCYQGDCGTYKWKIIRLKEKEMWIEEHLNDMLWSIRKLKPL
ncbi:MAG: hypothetical protein JKY52_20415 [Flavobacteriales bacterium]|nr:hypothetical protein [Flavobacteriales bacterium]